MSPEKPTKNASAQKQKIMIGIIVLVMIVVAWQLFGSSGGGGGGGTPAPTPTLSTANKPLPGGNAMASTGMPAVQGVAVPPPEMTQPKQAVVPINSEILKLQQQTQADYLASVNKLQMLKMQREIDEAKTAIATAELSRMTAEKSIADLITSKESGGNSADMGPIGGMPSSPFGSPPPAATTTTTTTTNPSIVVQAVPQVPVVPYNVLSVAYQGHKWSAVLGLQGKTMTVNVGDLLEDGSTVTSITRNRVTLKRDNKSRVLPVASNNI